MDEPSVAGQNSRAARQAMQDKEESAKPSGKPGSSNANGNVNAPVGGGSSNQALGHNASSALTGDLTAKKPVKSVKPSPPVVSSPRESVQSFPSVEVRPGTMSLDDPQPPSVRIDQQKIMDKGMTSSNLDNAHTIRVDGDAKGSTDTKNNDQYGGNGDWSACLGDTNKGWNCHKYRDEVVKLGSSSEYDSSDNGATPISATYLHPRDRYNPAVSVETVVEKQFAVTIGATGGLSAAVVKTELGMTAADTTTVSHVCKMDRTYNTDIRGAEAYKTKTKYKYKIVSWHDPGGEYAGETSPQWGTEINTVTCEFPTGGW